MRFLSSRLLVQYAGYQFYLDSASYDVASGDFTLFSIRVCGRRYPMPVYGFSARWNRAGLTWGTWLKGKRRAWMLRGPVVPVL